MQGILSSIGGVLWGAPMLILFLFTGTRLTLKSGFLQFRHPLLIGKTFFSSFFKKKIKGEISPFSAVCSVLGACLGTGNIVGVATAVCSGGPGTIFWMVFSSFFSMMIAYGENYLGDIYTRRFSFQKNTTGAFSYIKNGIDMPRLSRIYAFLGLMSALGMGNMAQSNSIGDTLSQSFNIPLVVIGIVIVVLCSIILQRGLKRIARLQTIAVPLAVTFYFVISIAVLIKFRNNIIASVKLILHEAFTPKAFGGFGIYKAMRYGISRGVFSNEAGLGSSTLLHAQADSESPEAQGIFAICEVFIDTVFMCGLTGLVITVSTTQSDLFGTQLSAAAYSAIGNIGTNGISLLTAIFAFLSLASCSFYAEKSFQYLFGDRHTKLFRTMYIIIAFTGAVCSPQIIWEIADICNGLMAIPNLFALNCLIKEIYYPQKSHHSLLT
ncbi:MAG: sodium:alanine symporter family protein [Clostridia bacterium]|nr:sodium:alanine symporter family protein [Clostridia bacterium]